MKAPTASLNLHITPAPEGAASGILVPEALPCPPAALHAGLPQYRYRLAPDTMRHEVAPLPLAGAWVVYAPSLFGLWAADFVQAIPDIAGLVVDKAWVNHKTRLLWWRWQLGYEQLRLGSDVASPAFFTRLRQAGLQNHLPCRTIGAWQQALAANKAVFSSPRTGNLTIFHFNQI